MKTINHNEIKRILVVGDIHGYFSAVRPMFRFAHERECDAIVQLGDFGWWDHENTGIDFLRHVNSQTKKWDTPLFFLDGNHENFTSLLGAYRPQPDGFATLECAWFDEACPEFPLLRYVPRGTRWEWAGKKFLGLGGAYSVDRVVRKLGTSYWHQECITNDDVDACGTDPVDVLFAHDAPFPDLFKMNGWGVDSGLPTDWKADIISRANREKVYEVVRTVKPKLVYHGHYHHPHETILRTVDGDVEVVGLGCERDGRNAYSVLDLEMEE